MNLKRLGTGAAMLLLLALFGCATTGGTTRALLARNYASMSNTQLQTYFRRLNDQISREERAAAGGGFSYGGAAAKKAPLPPRAKELQTRRNRVWQELSKRGLMP